MEKMKWSNLKNGQCPRCGGYLKQDEKGAPVFCTKPDSECGFFIGEKKLKSILEGLK